MSSAQPGGIAPATPSRHTIAQLATGGFLLLAGALFEAPFLLSSRAQEIDDFLANLFGAVLFALVGGVIYLLALRRVGLRLALLLALLLINLVAISGLAWIPVSTSQRFPLIAGLVMADAALLFIVGALVAGMHGQLGAWARGLILSLAAGAALAAIYYFFGGQFLAFGETRSSVPPYLNLEAFFATIVLAIAVYVLGRLWGREQAGA